jgi:anti-sigma B factor antagonist
VFSIQYEVKPDGYTICRPAGELDAFTVHQFRQALAEIASSRHLVIDLSGVPFVDSAGLGALIGGIRRVREIGGSVVVACSRRTLASLLHTTGIDRIVTVTESVEEAAAELSVASDATWGDGLLGVRSGDRSRRAGADVAVET